MKYPVFLLLLAACSLASCDKLRGFGGQFSSKKPPSASAQTGSQVSQIGEDGYGAFLQQPGKLVVVDFYADWCGPCRQLGPILEKIAAEQGGKIVIGKVNVDQNRNFAVSVGVNGIPDVRLFRDGKEVDRFVGLPAESEVRRRLEAQLQGLPENPSATVAPKVGVPQTDPQPMTKDWLPPGMQRR